MVLFSDSESESDSEDSSSDDSVDSDYDSNSPGPSGSSKKKVDEKIKIEDVPENIKKRLAPAPKKGMVLVKKKKVETKPVDDELEKKKKMLAYTQGKPASKFLSVEISVRKIRDFGAFQIKIYFSIAKKDGRTRKEGTFETTR